MQKNHLLLILIVTIFIFIGLGVVVSKNSLIASLRTPACPPNLAGIFTHPIVDLDNILAIQPLGFTNGMDHILPVDHTGITFKNSLGTDRYPVYAPSDIVITTITRHDDYHTSGNKYTQMPNFMMDFRICRAVDGWIEWINTLSPKLSLVFENGTKIHDEGPLNEGARAVNDTVYETVTLKAGELIGYSARQPSVSISIFDMRSIPTGVDPSYYQEDRRIHAICFSDLYAGELHRSFTEFFGRAATETGDKLIPRTGEPRCGQVLYNKVGTLQGDWFAEKPKDKLPLLQSEGKTISIIHNNYDPTVGIISIGGTIVPQAMTVTFTPNGDGVINREPSDTNTGLVYCYESDRDAPRTPQAQTGHDLRIISQLMDDHHMQIEAQKGSCTSTPTFSNPHLFER